MPATGLAYSSAGLSPLAYKGVSLLEGRVLLLGVSSEVAVRDTLIAAGRAVSCINFLPDKLWEVMVRAVLLHAELPIFASAGCLQAVK